LLFKVAILLSEQVFFVCLHYKAPLKKCFLFSAKNDFLNAELVLIEKIVFQTKIPDLTVPLKLPMKAKDVALGVEQALVITPEGAIEVLGGPNRGPVEGLHGPICVSYYCYQKSKAAQHVSD